MLTGSKTFTANSVIYWLVQKVTLNLFIHWQGKKKTTSNSIIYKMGQKVHFKVNCILTGTKQYNNQNIMHHFSFLVFESWLNQHWIGHPWQWHESSSHCIWPVCSDRMLPDFVATFYPPNCNNMLALFSEWGEVTSLFFRNSQDVWNWSSFFNYLSQGGLTFPTTWVVCYLFFMSRPCFPFAPGEDLRSWPWKDFWWSDITNRRYNEYTLFDFWEWSNSSQW